MIFLSNFEKVEENKLKVRFIHYMPFDPIDGLNKTKEELELEGVLIENIPEPKHIENKQAIMYWNPVDKQIFYEYEDVPKSDEGLEQQAELNAKLLKDNANMQIELDKQRELNSTLLLKIAELGGNANA
ncbi:hypothetical protein EXN65_20170 [Clostridium botulinum]|uniref:Phage protein n=2 Tax=Clostridium botulinum TaxID=1491 RepID=A0ABD7CHJ0_CLOBO|nr:hypothetical protein [Clostridium botulinum]EPS47287.1 hypothetical protein CFSAN002367_24286 [Clostridium botulinum CFSAN002367]ACQ53975.1 hypothetical protein CLJ_B1415 [Clostridium botulinum Ba4 str. 657]APQ95217.1 hypothetical protein RSJ3_2001 [Clostridium botulinum]AXG91459.1 hypothetical protein AGE29_06615 [Clostridium botulinum]KGO12756.1 hypothetical protein NZ45_15965 [Clostridium botulinum]